VLNKGGTLSERRVIMDDSSEFINETRVQFRVSDPVVSTSAPNGYTQARSEIKVLVPLTLDNGGYTTNVLDIKLSVDPETTDAETESMLVLGAQFLADSDFSEFWKKRSTE
jgi:hypothetical protein